MAEYADQNVHKVNRVLSLHLYFNRALPFRTLRGDSKVAMRTRLDCTGRGDRSFVRNTIESHRLVSTSVADHAEMRPSGPVPGNLCELSSTIASRIWFGTSDCQNSRQGLGLVKNNTHTRARTENIYSKFRTRHSSLFICFLTTTVYICIQISTRNFTL